MVQLTDGTGNVIHTYDYDAFGNEKNVDENNSNPFRYCGEYYDKETGDVYLRARYYDLEIGRFGSEDPIRDGSNWYVYCDGNPIMYHDPSGEKYIVDDIWNDMGQRSDTMMADPNTYNVTNWLSMGFVETLNGAVNPKKPLSLQHWVDSATVVTAVYGGYSAGSAASKAKVVTKATKTKPVVRVAKGGKSTAKGANGLGNSIKSNTGKVIDTTPSKNHTTVTKNPGLKGKPNSSVDIMGKNGELSTRRWFDKNGNQIRDVDMTNHGNPGKHPAVPHQHGPREH